MRAASPDGIMNQPLGDPVARLLDAIRRAKPVVALLGTDARTVSAVVDACVARLLDDPIRVVRVHGLPGVPLTLSQIVKDIGAGQQDGSRIDDDELIVRVLASRSGGESQVVLILEQAELLPLPTLVFLQVALAVFGTRTPRLQLLFAGRPNFAYLVDRDELAPLRDRLDAVIRVPPPLVDPALALPLRTEPGAGAGSSRRRWMLAMVPALLLAAGAATLARFWPSAAPPPVEVSAPMSRPVPAQVDPPAEAQALPQDEQPSPAPALPPQAQAMPEEAPPPLAPALPQEDAQPSPAPPPQAQPLPKEDVPPQAADAEPAPMLPPSREPDPAPPSERRAMPSGEQLTRFRVDFNLLLSQAEWGAKRLSENERARLFNEYLRWRNGVSAVSPP